MGREMGAVTHLCWGERWELSHTYDGESAGVCNAPVKVRELGIVTHL